MPAGHVLGLAALLRERLPLLRPTRVAVGVGAGRRVEVVDLAVAIAHRPQDHRHDRRRAQIGGVVAHLWLARGHGVEPVLEVQVRGVVLLERLLTEVGLDDLVLDVGVERHLRPLRHELELRELLAVAKLEGPVVAADHLLEPRILVAHRR